MPTRENVSQLESLVEATTQLAETKRQFDKIKYDIQVLKERSGIRQQGEGEVKMEEGVEDGLDGDGEGEDGRGQSLSRGRKHVSVVLEIGSCDAHKSSRGAPCRFRRWTHQLRVGQTRSDRREAEGYAETCSATINTGYCR